MPIAAAMIAPRLCVRKSPGTRITRQREQRRSRCTRDEEQDRVRDDLADGVLLQPEVV